jgi:hypothetical protein
MSWGSEIMEEHLTAKLAEALGLPPGDHMMGDLLKRVRVLRTIVENQEAKIAGLSSSTMKIQGPNK